MQQLPRMEDVLCCGQARAMVVGHSSHLRGRYDRCHDCEIATWDLYYYMDFSDIFARNNNNNLIIIIITIIIGNIYIYVYIYNIYIYIYICVYIYIYIVYIYIYIYICIIYIYII